MGIALPSCSYGPSSLNTFICNSPLLMSPAFVRSGRKRNAYVRRNSAFRRSDICLRTAELVVLDDDHAMQCIMRPV